MPGGDDGEWRMVRKEYAWEGLAITNNYGYVSIFPNWATSVVIGRLEFH